MANQCTICKKQFSKHSNLRFHVKRFHPDELNTIAPNKTFKCSALCTKCLKTFSKFSNLKKHVVKFHPDEIEQLILPKVYNYQCKECQKNFSSDKNYKYHKKIHEDEKEMYRRLRQLKCSLCNYVCVSKLILHDHFDKNHDIKISSEVLHFPSADEFKDWKNTLEEQTHSLYINEHGSYKTLNRVITTYVCQRSGYYIPKGTGKRRLKIQGSKKICGICPSEIHVKALESGEHEIHFIETHVGHDNTLEHLNLTTPQRMQIAEKIATKVPFSAILNEIRDSATNEKLERIHLITKKDLYNIKNLVIDERENDYCEEQPQFVQILSQQNGDMQQEELNAEKEKLKIKHLQLLEKITTFEQLEAYKKITASTILSLEQKTNKNIGLPSSSQNCSHNKPIEK